MIGASFTRSRLALEGKHLHSEGLRQRVQIRIVGDPDRRAAIRDVEYDLGPTFTERRRRVEAGADRDFAIEVEFYGDFEVAAQVTLDDVSGKAQTKLLTYHVAVPEALRQPKPAPRDEWRLPERGFRAFGTPSRVAAALELLIGAVAVLMAYLVIVLWPDGTDVVRLLGLVPLSLSADGRLVLLAAACGGLGSVIQAASSLISHPEVYSLNRAWVQWYLWRPVPGMVMGPLAYFVVRTAFLSADAPASAISPYGIAAVAGVMGLFSRQATTKLQEVFATVFAPLAVEPAFAEEENRMPVETAPQATPPSAEAARNQARRDAQAILRGVDRPPRELFQLAERLKGFNEFGLARRLYGRIRSAGDYGDLKPIRVGQRHALCTYKDPDLPAVDRFARALEILDEVDLLGGAGTADRQETLGLRGAVHKRRWQVEGQRADLERAVGYYLNGYELGGTDSEPNLATDQGYTGINAAYALDLLAREDAAEVAKTGAGWMGAGERLGKAVEIRRVLARLLPRLPDQLDENAKPLTWLRKEWWFHATIAEARFALGEFEAAIDALREYNRARELGDELPVDPRGPVPRWEFESTITQLASVAQIQADLAELLGRRPEFKGFFPLPAGELRQRARAALRQYLGAFDAGADRALNGKVGLALSGGGFRASLFHIGVLAYLAERDLLRHVEALSCVSGGSIVGAHYYLEVQRLLEAKPDGDIKPQDYVEIVERLERAFLAGVQTNIRCQVFGSVWANLRTFFQPGYTATRRLGELYETELYARVEDGRGRLPRYLPDLMVKPKGEGVEFRPKYDNWRRQAKVPILVLNATTLNTGHNWQFTASWMGEPPTSIDDEIAGNYRLRRMWHWEAPRRADRWDNWLLRPFAPPDYQKFRLGEAVAASSCVPGLFDPIVLPDLYEGKTVRLVDGGVYDNQGMASLLEQDCNVLIVSDASGQMDAVDHPGGGRVGVLFRSFSVSQARVRQAQWRELAARRRSGLLKGLMFMHLKKDLETDPVDWRECQDPHEASEEARPAERRGPLTRYGLQKNVQRLLSAIRTDLDSFTEVEAFALMTSGYRQAEAETRQLQGLPSDAGPQRPWRFLRIEAALSPGPGFDDLRRQLDVAAQVAGKVWRLWPPLTVLAAVTLLAGAFGLYRLWQVYRGATLLTVGSLTNLLLVSAGLLLAPSLFRLIRFRQTIQQVGIKSVLATALAIGFKIHLLVFDPIFLRLGRVGRVLKRRGTQTV